MFAFDLTKRADGASSRHIDIQDDDIPGLGPNELKHFRDVGGFSDCDRHDLAQDIFDAFPENRKIIDKQNPKHEASVGS
jgi:hypothetical protein